MAIGKLYTSRDNQFIADISYRIYENGESPKWSGELTIAGSYQIDENDIFIIELENGRQSLCHLKKRVNRAVSGLPPRYIYHVTGFA